MWAIVLMNERVTREERLQSPGEEIANSVSAGTGLIAAIAGIPLLLAFATQRGSNWTVAGALVFAATTVWLYLASTVYHALPRNRAKRLFRLFDPHGNLSSDCRKLTHRSLSVGFAVLWIGRFLPQFGAWLFSG